MRVVRDGVVGPPVALVFAETSPGLFQNDSKALATHAADGSPVSDDSPAHPGEIVLLSATGLGQTVLPLDTQDDGRLVTSTDPNGLRIQRFADLSVTLDDAALDPVYVQWCGLTTGAAGVYQITLQLPDSVGPNPSIRIRIGDQGSASGITLPVQP